MYLQKWNQKDNQILKMIIFLNIDFFKSLFRKEYTSEISILHTIHWKSMNIILN